MAAGQHLVVGNGEEFVRLRAEAFNIGTGVQTSDQQVYDTIAEATGYPEPPIYGEERKGDVKHSALDWSKAKRVLGWEPRYTFAQGVAKTVEYNREQLGL